MTKSIYRFEIIDSDGNVIGKKTRRCTNLTAHGYASDLLDISSAAAGVIGEEVNGLSVHSVYRN